LNAPPYHVPVLLNEVLNFLITDPSGAYVDATLGGGGHSEAILKRLGPEGRLVGIDRDPEAVSVSMTRLAGFSDRMKIVLGEFAEMDSIFDSEGIRQIDGVLFDLGVSSRQIDSAERGFSFQQDGPLDMRMGAGTAATAGDVVRTYSERQLSDLFWRFGEERNSRRIARAIVESRGRRPIETTGDLRELIRELTPERWQTKTLSRIFQAIRLEVNDELGQLQTGLDKAAGLLKKGGRMVVISYHSLEDRIVKRFFKRPVDETRHPGILERPVPAFRMLTRKVVTPSFEETAINPRSRSAKLRAAEKLI
jgi:16S rRNA (cytosine1402-N4)-methyltransferase